MTIEINTTGNVNFYTTNAPPAPNTGNVGDDYDAGEYVPTDNSLGSSWGMASPIFGGSTDIATMMLAVRALVQESQIDTAKTEVEGLKEENARVAQERLDAIKEQAKKADEAAKGGKIGEIFGWIAAAAMVIAGAILVATGVGGPAGVALLVGGITTMVMMTLQSETLGKAMGLEGSLMNEMVKGFAGALQELGVPEDKAKLIASAIIVGTLTVVAAVAGTVAGGPFLGLALATQTLGAFFTPENLQAMGVPEDAAPWVSMGISIGLALVGIAAGGASVKWPGGIAGKMGEAAAKAAQASAQTASAATEVGAKAATLTQKIGGTAGYITAGVSAAGTMAKGGADIYTGVKNKEAADAGAEAAELAADLLALQNYFDDQSEKLEKIYQEIQETYGVMMDIINQAGQQGQIVARVTV